jgi:hypothetical protein
MELVEGIQQSARLGPRSQAAKEALDAVHSTLVSSISGQADSAVVSEMLRQVDLVAQSRRARLIASEGAVPNLLWLVLLGGAAITIGYTFFLRCGKSAGTCVDDSTTRDNDLS